MTYEDRKVTHGIEMGAFSSIVKTEGGTLDTSTAPTIFTGLRSSKFETTQESKPFFADNQEHVRLSGQKSTEGTIGCYQFPKEFVINHLGMKQMPNGALVDTGNAESFIWQYIEKVTDEYGVTKRKLTVYYNVKASTPKGDSVTDEESVEAKEFEIPCTASPNNLVQDDEGNSVTLMEVTEDDTTSALIDLAYEQIVLPTTVVPGA